MGLRARERRKLSRNFEKDILQILAKHDGLTLLQIEQKLCKSGFVTHGHVRQKLTAMKRDGLIEWQKQGRHRTGSKVLWSLPKPKETIAPPVSENRTEPGIWLSWGGFQAAA